MFKSEAIEILAKNRIKICVDKCDEFRKIDKRCSVCKCYMPAKVRSPKSNCPKRLW